MATVFISRRSCDGPDETGATAPPTDSISFPGTAYAGRMCWWRRLPDGAGLENQMFRIESGTAGEGDRGDWLYLGTEDDLDLAARRLSVFTAALTALRDLEARVSNRPWASLSEIQRCERLVANPLLRPFSGRGARVKVVEPWLDYLDGYADLLGLIRLSSEQSREELNATEGDESPSALLLRSLECISPTRELEAVIPELTNRLNQLRRRTEDISDDIGHVGVLASVASLVARTNALAAVVAGVTVVLYYSGYSIGRFVGRAIAKLKGGAPAREAVADPGTTGDGGLASVIARLADSPVELRVSPELSPAETSAALRLWLKLLIRKPGRDRLPSTRLRSEPTGRIQPGAVSILTGGPIVRMEHPVEWSLEADIKPDRGKWSMVAGTTPLALADEEEQAGLISAGSSRPDSGPDLLLICGFRDTGGVAAMRELESILDGSPPPGSRDWLVTGGPETADSGYSPGQ